MPLHVGGDERAKRHDLEAPCARIVERALHEPRAEAAAFARSIHLGVRERDPVVAAVVRGEPDAPVAEPELVAALLRDVDDDGVDGRCVDLRARLIVPEPRDDPGHPVGLARVRVVEEALPVRVRVLPGLARLEILEDLARAAEELAILRLEDGDAMVPASARNRSRCSGSGSTCRVTKSRPSSVSTSRTADE